MRFNANDMFLNFLCIHRFGAGYNDIALSTFITRFCNTLRRIL